MDYTVAVKAAMLRARISCEESEGRKISQTKWAERIAAEIGSNTSRGSVHEWESGKAMPDAHVLLAVAKLAGLTVDRLILEAQPHIFVDELAEVRAELEALKRANKAARNH